MAANLEATISQPLPAEGLQHLATGARARVVGFSGGSRAYLRRLLAMGLIPGAELTVVRRAPLGDPILVEILGFQLSLRAQEAAVVQVQESPGG